MQVTSKNLSKTEVILSISAEPSELSTTKQRVLERLAQNVKLPGFRVGKAPLNLAEKHVDESELQQAFLEEALGKLYEQSVRSKNLRIVEQPKVTLKKFVPFSTLEFEAVVSVVSNIKLPQYKGVKVARPIVKVTAEDVDNVVQSLLLRAAERVPVKRGVQVNDEVVIDFKGTDDKGAHIAGAEAVNYPLLIGSNSFIPGFESELAGLKVGDKKTFTLKFPSDYGVQALANKKVTFSVTLRAVNEIRQPKLDDKFAASVSPFKTVKELKDDIKKQLTIEKNKRAEEDYESALVKAITLKSQVTMPRVLIEREVDRMLDEIKQNLLYRGQTFQEFLEGEGKSEVDYRSELAQKAEERVKASLVLAEIAEVEKLDVGLEELEVRIQHLKSQYKDESMRAELDKPQNRREIASRILTEKVLALLKQ